MNDDDLHSGSRWEPRPEQRTAPGQEHAGAQPDPEQPNEAVAGAADDAGRGRPDGAAPRPPLPVGAATAHDLAPIPADGTTRPRRGRRRLTMLVTAAALLLTSGLGGYAIGHATGGSPPAAGSAGGHGHHRGDLDGDRSGTGTPDGVGPGGTGTAGGPAGRGTTAT